MVGRGAADAIVAAMPDLPDLVAQASRGDQNAVESLIAAHLPALRAFVRVKAGALLLERESCSDLAQSVCRDLLENLDRYQWQGDAEFRRWLFTTAMRKIADRYEHWGAKRRRADKVVPVDDEGVLEGFAAIYTPSQHAIAREELKRVEDAMTSLTPEKQDVILMAKLMGLSHAEIAAQLGKSEGAVRTMLSRALAELSDRL